ncbi:hypothetical protein PoB_000933400 [Plakobranchus ocellatus]|uniref:Uncharacterized protein n=1 Tax=Plakobranchus ocellatus TaxID=259542 RepID=A0AAV3YIK0_9GAST|nr:hypothetical protein PoB_000933400 [Plakobranchus ocellatus]
MTYDSSTIQIFKLFASLEPGKRNKNNNNSYGNRRFRGSSVQNKIYFYRGTNKRFIKASGPGAWPKHRAVKVCKRHSSAVVIEMSNCQSHNLVGFKMEFTVFRLHHCPPNTGVLCYILLLLVVVVAFSSFIGQWNEIAVVKLIEEKEGAEMGLR